MRREDEGEVQGSSMKAEDEGRGGERMLREQMERGGERRRTKSQDEEARWTEDKWCSGGRWLKWETGAAC